MILLTFILVQPLFLTIALLYSKLILWKMHQDLETWISFGTGNDIFMCTDQRKEYQYYVNKKVNDTASKVLVNIRNDLRTNTLLKPIYFQILFLLAKGKKF